MQVKSKLNVYRNGWLAMMEPQSQGMYLVLVRSANGDVYDKVRCDDYRNALDYFRAFNRIAKVQP
jgi:hypothetical protein